MKLSALIKKNESRVVVKDNRTTPPTQDPGHDDRHHCHQCQSLRTGYCITQKFRPVDDIPRRCIDFRARVLL